MPTCEIVHVWKCEAAKVWKCKKKKKKKKKNEMHATHEMNEMNEMNAILKKDARKKKAMELVQLPFHPVYCISF
jgi:hypothetical protein